MKKKLQAILEAEGLSCLFDKFNEQGVTDSILCDLTDSDLKELGVDKLGERRRLLAAFGKPSEPSGLQQAGRILNGLLEAVDDIGSAMGKL